MNNEQIKTLVRWAYRDGYRCCERGRELDGMKYLDAVRFISLSDPFSMNELIDGHEEEVSRRFLKAVERAEKNETRAEELKAEGWDGLSGDVIGIDEGKEETSHD